MKAEAKYYLGMGWFAEVEHPSIPGTWVRGAYANAKKAADAATRKLRALRKRSPHAR